MIEDLKTLVDGGYVRHLPECHVATDGNGEYVNCYRPLGGCDCGLAALLARVEGATREYLVYRCGHCDQIADSAYVVDEDGNTPPCRHCGRVDWHPMVVSRVEGATDPPQDATTALIEQVERLTSAILWALGEHGEFGEEPEPLAGKYRRRFWWRSELRERAFGAKAPPSPLQESASDFAAARAAEALSWALDLIDLYDERLAAIDGPEKVYTAVHKLGKIKAQDDLHRLRLLADELQTGDEVFNILAAHEAPPQGCKYCGEPTVVGATADRFLLCRPCWESMKELVHRVDAENGEAPPQAWRQALQEIADRGCQDARGSTGWTCREFDGTGLWCASCLAAEALATEPPADRIDPSSARNAEE